MYKLVCLWQSDKLFYTEIKPPKWTAIERIDFMFQGEIAGYSITHEERLRYISQLAENLGYENLESLSLYVSQELLHNELTASQAF